MVTLDDLKRLVWTYHQKVGTKRRSKKKDQKFIDLLLKRYIYSLEVYGSEENALSKDISMSRTDIIWEVWELKGKASVDTKIHSFETTKSTINANLEKIEAEGLNPKNIRIYTAQGQKDTGEEANYFVTVGQPIEKTEKDINYVVEKIDDPENAILVDKLYSRIKEEVEPLRNHSSLKFYVPLNCAETIYSRESDLKLSEEVDKFLSSEKTILLLLGDSGSGKSTFCTHLLLELMDRYQKENNAPLPILIQLGTSQKALEDGEIIEKEIRKLGIPEEDIPELRTKNKLAFILDGYDELEIDREDKQERKKNVFTTNRLGEWKAKIIITCRTQALEDDEDYRSRFCKEDPISNKPYRNSLKTLYIVPFSDHKVESYIKKYAPSENSQWKDWHSYKDEITRLYNLKELSTNPLLLSIITKILPKAKIKGTFTRAKLYEEFFEQWFEREKANLKIKTFFRFAEKLAFEMFLTGKTEIEYEKENDKDEFDDLVSLFAPDKSKDIRARSGCPIRRTEDNIYRFMHKSFQEFCVARKLFTELKDDKWDNLNKRLLTEEPAIIFFLVEMDVGKDKLMQLVKQSRYSSEIATASSNSATVLNAAKYSFSGKNLSGINIPEANLYGAVLDNTNLSEANLEKVNFENSFLKNTNFHKSIMTKVKFGEKPYLVGHDCEVKSVNFSPDGKMLASGGGFDHTVRLWDVETTNIIKIFEGHRGWVNSVNFSPDGKMLASGSSENLILWDIKTGDIIKILEGHVGQINCVRFSLDGKMLASGSNENTIILWDWETGNVIKTLKEPIGGDNTIKLWDTKTGNISGTVKTYFPINEICFSPDGKRLAVSNSRPIIVLWNIEIGEVIKNIRGHTGYVNSVDFSPDGNILASGSEDRTIRLWDIDENSFKTSKKRLIQVKSVDFSQDGKILASGGDPVKLYNSKTGKIIRKLESFSNEVCFSSDGKMLVGKGGDKTIKLWDIETGNTIEVLVLKEHRSEIRSFSLSSSFKMLATSGSQVYTVMLWDIETGNIIKALEGHDYCITSVCFSPNGMLLASGSHRNRVNIWDIETGNIVKKLFYTRPQEYTGFSSDIGHYCVKSIIACTT